MNQAVDIHGLYKSYRMEGKDLPVLDGVSLCVDEGEFVSIIGPSGCGKSTLFRIMAGLETDYAGSVIVDGQDCSSGKPRMAYMLQKDLLLPWRTVWKNIVLPLELAGTLNRTEQTELEKMAGEFGLSGFLSAYPDELSGGMRQKAALLRTWLMNGSIMLLDEPFGALDALTRNQMQDWLTDVWENHRKTVLFITHDIEEAVYLSDRVLVMSPRPGKIMDNIRISFERPRRRDVMYTQTFLDYKKHLMSSLQIKSDLREQ